MKAFLVVLVVALVCSASAQYNNNREANAKAHKTDRYRGDDGKPQTEYVILRRLQSFVINVDPAFGAADAQFSLVPSLSEYKDKSEQKLDVVKRDTTSVTLSNPGAIGIFKLKMTAQGGKSFTSSEQYIFVFNPYSDKDDAFIDPTASAKGGADIAEHIENEYGAVWQSDPTGKSWQSWIYNQFDMAALLTSQELLFELSNIQRSKVYLVARTLTWRTQNVLRGRWDGQYSDGKNPGFWSSSTEILTQYRQSRKTTVKYGQCWVFASLLTTLSRTLGFASHPMTNINSAHEKKGSSGFACDCQMNYNEVDGGYEAGSGSTCSIWNFHVWNHGWFKRPDLASTGVTMDHNWNAYDATPQESSSGPSESPFTTPQYYCGPASISGLKSFNGCTAPKPELMNFDAQFIRSESNAVTTFNVKKKGASSYTKLRTDPSHVGEAMYYKVADSQCGSSVSNGGYNRLCIGNAARMYSVAGTFAEVDANEELFRADFSGVGKDQYNDAGKAFKAKIFAAADKLKAAGVKKVEYSIMLHSITNQGNVTSTLKKVSGVYDPSQPTTRTNVMELQVGTKDWASPEFLNALRLSSSLQLVFVALPDKGNGFGTSKIVRLNPGVVTLECGKRTQPTGSADCSITVTNTMPVKLTGVTVKLSASSQGVASEAAQKPVAAGEVQAAAKGNDVILFLEKASKRQVVRADDISGRKGTKLQGTFKVGLNKPGKTLIVATVSSNELPPLSGEYEVTVA